MERESELSMSLLIKVLIPSGQGSTFMTASNPDYLAKAPSPYTNILGIRASTFEFAGRGTHTFRP